MRILFMILVFCPLFAFAQNALPRFENDTLFTSSGYKIYKGQTLQFGKGTGKNATFRFIIFISGANSNSLQNASITVKELKNFERSSFANGYTLYELTNYGFGKVFIEILGTIHFKDGSQGHIDIKMNFDEAIESSPVLPSELIVPDEFKKNEKANISEVLKKIFTLYKNGVFKKEEFEIQKKKVLISQPLLTPIDANRYVLPRFENDTVYTTCGYKIYKGATLQFGIGTGHNGKFRFINIKSGITADSLANKSLAVDKLKNFGISSLGNGYIEIVSFIFYKDGSRGYIDLHIAFDNAIENEPGLPSELIVPAEFRNKQEVRIAREINDLYQLNKAGALTNEEYENQKKKLLNRQ